MLSCKAMTGTLGFAMVGAPEGARVATPGPKTEIPVTVRSLLQDLLRRVADMLECFIAPYVGAITPIPVRVKPDWHARYGSNR